MKSIIEKLFIVMFLLMCLIPLVLFENHSEVISKIDNDYLPEYSGLRNRDLLKNYFSKRIGLRTEFVRLNYLINDKLFHTIANNKDFYGKRDYIFAKENSIEYNDYFKDFINYLIKLNDYLQEKGIKFYVVINPSKNIVLEEFLFEYQKQNYDYLDTFIYELQNKNIVVVDNVSYLKECKNKKEFYNKKHDPYHWNDIGALYGTNHIIDALKKDFVDLRYINQNDYSVEEKNIEFSLSETLLINEKVEKFNFHTIYEDITSNYRNEIEISDIFNEFFYYKTENKNNLKALVFEGSYYLSEERNKFLIANFSDLICVHNYENIFNANYYVEKFEPNLVIFELANYTMQEYFFSQWKMNNNALVSK